MTVTITLPACGDKEIERYFVNDDDLEIWMDRIKDDPRYAGATIRNGNGAVYSIADIGGSWEEVITAYENPTKSK